MSLQDFSDDEIIKECFRRMYSDESDIIGIKVWTIEDIISKAPFECTKQMAKEIVEEELNLDALTDCYDAEWDEINYAVLTYKEKKDRNDTRTV